VVLNHHETEVAYMHRAPIRANPRFPRVRPWLLRAFGLAFVVGAGLASSVAIGSASTSTTTSAGSTAGSTTTTTTAKTTTQVLPPANAARPSISGTARDGQLLSANNGSWTNSPSSYTYQWQRCASDGGGCGAISGADSQHYTVSSTDVGHRLRVRVTASNAGGSGTATSDATDVVQAASAGNPPANVKPPFLAGIAEQGARLTVNNGTWSGSSPIGFDYTWQRCDANGNGCSTFIAHNPNATGYTLTAADIGHTLRVEVTATNKYGSSYLTSPHTSVVVPAKTVQQVTTIAVKDVSLPDRLVIDGVQFSPNPTLSRTTPIQARFHVSDSHGLSVQGALVFLLGLPYGWTYNAPEQATGPDGWVTLSVQPTANMPLRRGDLVMFVRARKPGGSVLAGVSTRRLVQEGIR
jgi:hypothetical protein